MTAMTHPHSTSAPVVLRAVEFTPDGYAHLTYTIDTAVDIETAPVTISVPRIAPHTATIDALYEACQAALNACLCMIDCPPPPPLADPAPEWHTEHPEDDEDGPYYVDPDIYQDTAPKPGLTRTFR